MARKPRKSDADATAEALFGFLKMVPFWVGPILAGAIYLLADSLIPALLAGSPGRLGMTLAGIPRIFAPWIAIVILVIWMLAEGKKFADRRLLDTCSDVSGLRTLSWQEFERLVGEAFRRKGYLVGETPSGADGGVDLILTKNDERTLVQCKQWKTWKVGVKPVRELYGVVVAQGAVRGIVVCCGTYTAEARKFAHALPIELIDGPKLRRMIDEVKRSPTTGPLRTQQSFPEGASSTPACPKCDSPMVLRTAKKGTHAGSQFYGCTRYPACRGLRNHA